MFTMNGHDLCLRKIINTYILVGNITAALSFIGVNSFTTIVHPCTSMTNSDNVQNEWQYLVNFSTCSNGTYIDTCWRNTAID